MKKKSTSFILMLSLKLSVFGQSFYIPSVSNQVDSATYKKYIILLKAAFFEDSVEQGSANKHNMYIAYANLNAPIDTVFKFVYRAIAYDPIQECESSCKMPSYTYPYMVKKYPKKWREVCLQCDSIFAQFNHKLMDTLKNVSQNDQMYRKDTNLSFGSNSEAWKKQNELDTENLKIIEHILSNYGYPGKRLVGSELSDIAFIVIQHASLEKQELYFPLIQKAVENRDLDKINLPYLIDRIRMGKKLPQLYGTQLIWNKEKEKLELYPVEDIKNVDVRRDKMNLYPLRDYLKENNVDTIINKD